MSKILFTSESVTEGHPDKICDQISDAILDALLAQDPMSRVACETAITTGLVLVMGEVTTTAQVDLQNIIRNTIREIGYDASEKGFDANTCGVMVALDKQSTDIAMGVDKALEAKLTDSQIEAIGAGDQGMISDSPGSPSFPPVIEGPQRRNASLPASGRKIPGNGRIRRIRKPFPYRCRCHLQPAQRGCQLGSD